MTTKSVQSVPTYSPPPDQEFDLERAYTMMIKALVRHRRRKVATCSHPAPSNTTEL